MHRINHLNGLVVLLLFVLLPHFLLAQGNLTIRTVVIDPGHGGHDPGAVGRQSKEKNINLSVALKLGNMIQRNFKDVNVIYTRDRDKFVELYMRAQIANQNKADLFISIHCNASENRAMQGAETYVMGLHKSKANLDIAKLENASILLESDYQSTYDGFDPNSDESYILFNLHQNANLDRSTLFASAVQSQMTKRTGLQNRGVRQAGFLVLYKTAMPSVLVETGYISNSTDEKFLISSQGQDFVASAIFNAFKSFATPGNNHVDKSEAKAETDTSEEKNEVSIPAEVITASSKLEFRIQVATSATKLPESARIFTEFKQVKMYKHGGMFKYTVGSYPDPDKAKKNLEVVKSRGYGDSFIVIFRNNERIPQDEANLILRK
jgi:N-acetylmuramoyl-L-alanine amidase